MKAVRLDKSSVDLLHFKLAEQRLFEAEIDVLSDSKASQDALLGGAEDLSLTYNED